MATNTAASFTNHTGNGSAGPFNISFSYLSEAEVNVTVGGVLKTITTHYTFTSGTQITFTSGNEPGNGVAVKFQRDTNISAKKVDFQDGSVLTETDLDTNADQVLFAQQEIIDKLGGIEENATADQTNAEIRTAVEAATDSNVFTDADHSKLNAIEASATADQTASEIRTLVESASDSNVFTDADHSKLNAIEASATADQTNAEIRTAVEAATDSNVFTDADHTKLNSAATLTDTQTLTNKTLTTPVINELSGTAVVTSGTSTSDNKIYSAKRAGEIFYGKDTVGEIQSGETWSSSDDKVATTAAIDARVIDLVDDVGGFVPIANETSFPNANPDINNGAGTIVSIGSLAGDLTSGNTGIISIANGTVGNSTVTITGAALNTTYSAGYGMLVETTSTPNTYHFHRLSSKATEVTTVAGNITNINAVANNATNINTVSGNNANITTVAGIASNVTTVAGIQADVTAVAGDAADIGTCSTNIGNIAAIGSDLANNYANITDYGSITGAVSATSGTSDITTVANAITNVNTVAGKATEIGNLGTADAVADMNLLGTTAVVEDMSLLGTTACVADMALLGSADTVADMAILGTTDCVADMAILATADVVADLNTLGTADVVSDLNTLGTADVVSDMNTLAAISANLTTVATNNANVTICANSISNINSASTHATNALAYRDAASGILTQTESAPYNLSDSASTHTAWGNITDTGANAVFANETSNTLLTMSEGSSNYNYGSIT